MTFLNALAYVRSKRSIVNPNYGFQNELKKFEINLKKNKKEEKDCPRFLELRKATAFEVRT